ncbi:hypothetical protein GCM10011579_067440 [Streptomyces albiflavescens]|uniref:Uncharacterized protein n=1 Tax=Streptomyces albiflavescens TaxID=1623582 RepID=A0A917YBX5_9ACTN|nr:hypothetical protein GCM10011579_067440 [Streptomyces albiflavescens]
MEYERSHYRPVEANWTDLRVETQLKQGERAMTAWCHGATGIGLARLCSLQLLDDPAMKEEVEAALRTTLSKGFGGNHCLCHGDLGNLELLIQAADTKMWEWVSADLQRITTSILGDIHLGWACGMLPDIDLPGLMTGLAGIGYQLLRIAAPRTVPSVLLLSPSPR